MKKNSITINYIYNFIYQLILAIIPLCTTPHLTKTLGATNLGIYSYTYSIITILFFLSSLGINTYGQREIAYNRDNIKKRSKILLELFIIRIISTTISLFILLILLSLETKYKLHYQIFSIYLIANIFDISWFYQGLEKFKLITIKNSIIRTLYLISIFIFIKDKSNLTTYIFLYSSMTLLTNLSLWTNLKNNIILPQNINIKKHIKPIILFFIPQIASLFYTVLDKTMLGILSPNIKEVSFYEQTSYIVKTLLMFITTISTIMISKISNAHEKKDYNKITNYLNIIINFIWIIGTPIIFGLCATIKKFVPWFYGNEYTSIIKLVYIMSPIILIISLNNLIGIQFLISTNNHNKYIKATIMGAFINFILNLILIPKLNTIGAVISSLIAELIILLIELYYFKKILPNINIMKNSLKYISFSTILFITTHFTGELFKPVITTTILQVLTGLITYTILLLISKDKFTYNQLKKIVTK